MTATPKRTYELHACAKQVKRAAGRSSIAAAAYRSGEILKDQRTGLIHDYSRKGGIEASALYAPDNAPAWAFNREKLWNEAEFKENRSNSTLAHELVIGFPAEFNLSQRKEAGEKIAQELVNRYGCAADIAYHQPHRQGDQRNFHAHILFTTRGFDPDSRDGWSRSKFRHLSADRINGERGETTSRGQDEIKRIRTLTAQIFNDIAERDGLAVTTEHLSYRERGLQKTPTQHMGPKANKIEREGQQSERGNINRAIRSANDSHERVERAHRKIRIEYNRMQNEIMKLEKHDIARLLAQKHKHFQEQQEAYEHARKEFLAAQSQLQNIGLAQTLLGRKSALEQNLKDKEKGFEMARQRLEELSKDWAVDKFMHGRWSGDEDLHASAGALRAYRYEAYMREKARYEENKVQLDALQHSQKDLSRQERIMGAITGRADERDRQIAQLKETIKNFEASRAYQAEQRFLQKKVRHEQEIARLQGQSSNQEEQLSRQDFSEDPFWLFASQDLDAFTDDQRREEARDGLLDHMDHEAEQGRGRRSSDDH